MNGDGSRYGRGITTGVSDGVGNGVGTDGVGIYCGRSGGSGNVCGEVPVFGVGSSIARLSKGASLFNRHGSTTREGDDGNIASRDGDGSRCGRGIACLIGRGIGNGVTTGLVGIDGTTLGDGTR